ncbi:TspO/MBR family protein [Spirillospora sp. NPDC049652]
MRRRRPTVRWKTYGATTAAVTATAALGGAAVDTDNDWYRTLAKPPWQPPSWAFGAVWTPLYASVAWASGRALLTSSGSARRTLATSLGVSLAMNVVWNHLFFARRNPKAGVVGTLLLDASNADLVRRTARIDTAAAAALLPYATWCLFATALNADIARRNRDTG